MALSGEKHGTYTVKNLMSKLNNWRKNNGYHDVTIVIGERRFHSHKAVLVGAVEYFRRKLTSKDIREKARVTMEFPDIDPNGFEMLLDYLYTERLQLSEKTVKQVLSVAEYFQIKYLRKKILNYLRTIINVDNVFDFYNFAQKCYCNALEDYAVRFIQENLLLVSKSVAFSDTAYEMLQESISSSSESMALTEMEKFEIVVDWVKYDSAERSQYLPELFKCISFDSIDDSLLVEVVLKHELVLSDLDNVKTVAKKITKRRNTDQIENGVRVLSVKNANLIAIDIVEQKIKRTFTISKMHREDFQIISRRNTMYMSTFAGNRNDLHYFENTKWVSLNSCVTPRRFTSMTLLDCSNMIYAATSPDGDNNATLCVYNLETDRWFNSDITSQGPLISYGNVIYSFSTDNSDGINIILIDPNLNTAKKRCLLDACYTHDIKGAIFNGRIYVMSNDIIEVYDIAANKSEIISEEANEVNNLRSLIEYRGKLYALNSKPMVNIYDPTTNMWSEQIELYYANNEPIYNTDSIALCKF